MKILYAVLLTSILLPALAFSADDPMVSLFNFQSKMVKLGSVAAMMKLGEMYEQGQGTNQNWDKALDMYQQAQSEDYPGAKDSIQRVKQKKKQGLSAIKIKEAEEKRLKEAVKINKRISQKARLEKEASARKQQAAKNRLIQEQAAKKREELRIAEQKKLKKTEVKAQTTAEEIPGYDEGDEEEDKTAKMKKLKKKEVKAQTTVEEISGYDEGDEEEESTP